MSDFKCTECGVAGTAGKCPWCNGPSCNSCWFCAAGCDEGDPSRSGAKGLYDKYTVTHKDGGPVQEHAEFFVLRLDTDATARLAALAYADLVRPENPKLASDLYRRLAVCAERSRKDNP